MVQTPGRAGRIPSEFAQAHRAGLFNTPLRCLFLALMTPPHHTILKTFAARNSTLYENQGPKTIDTDATVKPGHNEKATKLVAPN